jgi:hypothetical protein
MSLSAIASTVKTQFVSAVQAAGGTTATGGGTTSFTSGSTASGAYMVQGAGASTGGSLIKQLLVGTAIGAGVGLGATFLVPGLREVTMFGATGWAAKGIIAAIGGAVGAIGALVVHFVGAKKASLAMEAQAQQAQQQAAATPPPATAGETYRIGSKGSEVLTLQKNLKSLGLYYPKVSGTFDKTTASSVRRYEIMKGVQPTGIGSPDLVAAVAQDSTLVKQLA